MVYLRTDCKDSVTGHAVVQIIGSIMARALRTVDDVHESCQVLLRAAVTAATSAEQWVEQAAAAGTAASGSSSSAPQPCSMWDNLLSGACLASLHHPLHRAAASFVRAALSLMKKAREKQWDSVNTAHAQSALDGTLADLEDMVVRVFCGQLQYSVGSQPQSISWAPLSTHVLLTQVFLAQVSQHE